MQATALDVQQRCFVFSSSVCFCYELAMVETDIEGADKWWKLVTSVVSQVRWAESLAALGDTPGDCIPYQLLVLPLCSYREPLTPPACPDPSPLLPVLIPPSFSHPPLLSWSPLPSNALLPSSQQCIVTQQDCTEGSQGGWEFWGCLLLVLSANDSEPESFIVDLYHTRNPSDFFLWKVQGEKEYLRVLTSWCQGKGSPRGFLGPRYLTAVSKREFWSPGRCLSWTSHWWKSAIPSCACVPFGRTESVCWNPFSFLPHLCVFRKWDEYSRTVTPHVVECL